MRPRACADSCLGGKAAAADPLVLLSGMFVLVSAVGCVTSLLSVAKVVVKVADVRAVVYCVTFHLTATALLRQSWPFPKNSISISLPLTLLLLRVLLLLLLLPDHSLICSLSAVCHQGTLSPGASSLLSSPISREHSTPRRDRISIFPCASSSPSLTNIN